MLGDNFYSSGLHPTPADPKSEARIKKTYEDVYTAPSLSTIPFWVCAGNHDHLGNVTNQIEYSTSPQNLNIASSTTKGATISAGKRCTKSVATPLQPSSPRAYPPTRIGAVALVPLQGGIRTTGTMSRSTSRSAARR